MKLPNKKRMKFVILLVFIGMPLFAQYEKIIINFTMEELAFAINRLNSIEITKEETAPFMDLKNLLSGLYKLKSAEQAENADVVLIIPQARNFLLLMQRSKIQGSDALLLQGIIGKISDALKKTEKSWI